MSVEEYQAAANRAMPEKDVQASVIEYARAGGYTCWHDNDSRKNDAGFPDLVCVRPGGPVWFIECKAERGKLRPEQLIWRDALRDAPGVIHAVIRPSQLEQLFAYFVTKTTDALVLSDWANGVFGSKWDQMPKGHTDDGSTVDRE